MHCTKYYPYCCRRSSGLGFNSTIPPPQKKKIQIQDGVSIEDFLNVLVIKPKTYNSSFFLSALYILLNIFQTVDNYQGWDSTPSHKYNPQYFF